MVLHRDKGGVEALRRCGFAEEEEMHIGVLSSPYVEAKRGEGREWRPRLVAAWRRKGGGLAQRMTRGRRTGGGGSDGRQCVDTAAACGG
jgi:hypothetical protein